MSEHVVLAKDTTYVVISGARVAFHQDLGLGMPQQSIYLSRGELLELLVTFAKDSEATKWLFQEES